MMLLIADEKQHGKFVLGEYIEHPVTYRVYNFCVEDLAQTIIEMKNDIDKINIKLGMIKNE